MDLDPFMIGSALRLVLAQRLVRPLCEKCKTKRSSAVPAGALSAREAAILEGAAIYDSKGCAECAHTGYRGRRGVFEALAVTDELEELIASKASVVDIRELALRQGMITLRESGLRIVASGDTSIDEVLATTVGEIPAS